MKILVIGCGSIGQRHARNAAGLGDLAVTDTDVESAERVARKTGGIFFSHLPEALAWGPDKVVVAVPNRHHIPLARKAVAAGADVLIEKPISHSTDHVAEFLADADNLQRKVVVGCNMRFHPAVAALRKALPEIGRTLFARAHVGNYLPSMRPGKDYRELYCARREEGGGVILDAIHEIDYLAWLFGPVRKVTASAEKLGDLDIDVEDWASLVLKHASGSVSEVHLDYLRPFKRRGCEIVGERGMLLWQSEGKAPEGCRVGLYRPDTRSWTSLYDTDRVDGDAPYQEMLQAFVRGDVAPGALSLLTGRDALDELRVALGAAAAAPAAFTPIEKEVTP